MIDSPEIVTIKLLSIEIVTMQIFRYSQYYYMIEIALLVYRAVAHIPRVVKILYFHDELKIVWKNLCSSFVR